MLGCEALPMIMNLLGGKTRVVSTLSVCNFPCGRRTRRSTQNLSVMSSDPVSARDLTPKDARIERVSGIVRPLVPLGHHRKKLLTKI